MLNPTKQASDSNRTPGGVLFEVKPANTFASLGSSFDGGLNFGIGTGSLFGNTANTSTIRSGTNTFGGIGTNTVDSPANPPSQSSPSTSKSSP